MEVRVKVLDQGQNHPYMPEFFPQHNLDSNLLSRYVYGDVMQDGCVGQLLMTIYNDDYPISVVEFNNRIYLISTRALEVMEG